MNTTPVIHLLAVFPCQIASDYLCLRCYRAHIAPPLTGVLFDKVQQCNNAEHHMNEKPQKTREKNVIKTLLYKTFTRDILLQIVLSLFAIIMNIAPPQKIASVKLEKRPQKLWKGGEPPPPPPLYGKCP